MQRGCTLVYVTPQSFAILRLRLGEEKASHNLSKVLSVVDTETLFNFGGHAGSIWASKGASSVGRTPVRLTHVKYGGIAVAHGNKNHHVMDKLGNKGQGGGFLPSVLRPGGEEYTGRFSKKCCDRRRAVSASRFSTSFKDLSDAMVSPQDSFSPPDCHCLPMLSIRAFIWAGAMPKRVGRPNMIPS